MVMSHAGQCQLYPIDPTAHSHPLRAINLKCLGVGRQCPCPLKSQ